MEDSDDQVEIMPEDFYSDAGEKIKFNWFCYELSLGLYDALTRKVGKKFAKFNIGDRAITDFSIYFAKSMKSIILEKLSGKIKTVYFSHKTIESFFPKISDRMVNAVLDVIAEVWDDQLGTCEVCPTRCISEKEVYCTMFDDGPYGKD